MSAPRPPIPAATAGLCAVVLGCVLTSCAWHAGTPPTGRGLAVGDVAAPVVEPGVADALAEALGAAIRRRGAMGPDPVDALVEEASFVPAAAGSGRVGAWTATLRVRFRRLGPAARDLVLSRDLLVAAPDPASSAGIPQARAAAFALLARAVAEEAVEVLVLPAGSP